MNDFPSTPRGWAEYRRRHAPPRPVLRLILAVILTVILMQLFFSA